MLREVKVARRVLVINANQLLQLGNVDPETGEILQEAQAHSGWAWGHFRKRITAYVKQAALAVAA